MEFNYYYGTEADQFSFIRIPKVLLKNETFRVLSIQAKVMYGLLLDRMSLSVKNHWLDDNNRVYIIYQIADIQDDLRYSKKKSIEYLGELETIDLVEKRKRGFGLPNILYVKNFMSNETVTSRGVEKYTSVKTENVEESDKTDGGNIEESEEKPEINENVGISDTRSSHVYTSRGVEKFTSRGVQNDTSGGTHVSISEVPVWAPLKSNIKYINTNMSNTESHRILSSDRLDEMDEYHNYENLIR
ncbi:MAG: replication initiator protein A [Clostridia bacterium]|nr:replication initiator protein A [Clostridia bacterium]